MRWYFWTVIRTAAAVSFCWLASIGAANAGSTELLPPGANYKNCSDAAGCGPGAAAPDFDANGWDKFKKHFSPKHGRKPKLCDIIAYGPKGQQPGHVVTVVGFDSDGNPLTVGQNGNPPADGDNPRRKGNVTLDSVDMKDPDWDSYTPNDNEDVPKNISDASHAAEKSQPPTTKDQKKEWLKVWLLCRDRNYAAMGPDATGKKEKLDVEKLPISYRPVRQPADAPQYVAIPSGRPSGGYAGGEIVKNSARVGSTETLADTGFITNQFTDSGDPAGAGFVVGYNWSPFGNWTVGPFVSFDWLHQTVNHTFPAGTYLGTTTHWFVNAGGKLGYSFAPGWTVYGLAAAAWVNQDLNISFFPGLSSRNVTTPGFTVGIGTEYRPAGWMVYGLPLSLFAQYQHTWFDTATFNSPAPASPFFNYAFKRSDDTVKFGINIYLQPVATAAPTPARITK